MLRESIAGTRSGGALLASVAIAALAAGLISTLARAEDAHVNHMSFELQSPYQGAPVRVSSSNGQRWDTILPGELGVNAVMQVDTAWPGYVEKIGIFLGKCSNTQCGSNPRVYAEEPMSRDYNKSKMINFSVDKLKAAAPSIFGLPYGEQILDACNRGHNDATMPHTAYVGADASFTVNTRKAADLISESEVRASQEDISFNGGDHTRQAAFLVQIECLATSKTTADPRPDPHRTKTTAMGLDLFLSTYALPAGAQSGPRGTQCKPLKVTTRVGTDKAGPVNVKLWRQVNGGAITSETKAMQAEALGGGKFGDDWNKFEHFTQTTTVQYKAEVLGGTFAPQTPWKSITIHCNGDFAAPQTNANPDGKPTRGKPDGQVVPPVVVTPPPACAGTAAKRRAACIKTAPLPDKRKEFAESKRREAAERQRKAAQEAELLRRQARLNPTAATPPPANSRSQPYGRPRMLMFRPQMIFR